MVVIGDTPKDVAAAQGIGAAAGITIARALVRDLFTGRIFVVVLGAAGVSRVWVQQRLGVRQAPAGRRDRAPALAFAAAAAA